MYIKCTNWMPAFLVVASWPCAAADYCLHWMDRCATIRSAYDLYMVGWTRVRMAHHSHDCRWSFFSCCSRGLDSRSSAREATEMLALAHRRRPACECECSWPTQMHAQCAFVCDNRNGRPCALNFMDANIPFLIGITRCGCARAW